MDPYERADLVSDQYDDWLVKNDYVISEVMYHAIGFLQTFKEYPPSQLPASFSIDQVEKQLNDEIGKKLKVHAPNGGD